MELTPDDASGSSRYKKIVADESGLDALFVEQFVSTHERAPVSIVLDVDATDDPLHGHQEGRFFHGYYRSYCYLPLYIFCGEHLLCARLRPSNIDGAPGTVEELERIIAQIRRSWPQVQVIVRGDSGFCREELMGWCEANEVDYVLGLAKNTRLIKAIAGELAQAYPAKALYEELYCARGDMENRIKEQQLALFADRTSTATMRANQLRLYFSSLAYCALQALRRARAQRHLTGARSVRHHTAQAAQARRAGACHGTQYLGLVLPELSVRRAVHPHLP